MEEKYSNFEKDWLFFIIYTPLGVSKYTHSMQRKKTTSNEHVFKHLT